MVSPKGWETSVGYMVVREGFLEEVELRLRMSYTQAYKHRTRKNTRNDKLSFCRQ